jgi:uncharacterized protein HemY
MVSRTDCAHAADLRWRWFESQDLKAAVQLFHEMEDTMGKSAALCENIAHTYNSLGEYEKAEAYFRDSLRVWAQPRPRHAGCFAALGSLK